MSEVASPSPHRVRLSLEVEPTFLQHLRRAAAEHDMSVREYVLGAIEQQFREDARHTPASPLTGATDPVLAELWDNPRDATYDRG